jgi:hypothetical protein
MAPRYPGVARLQRATGGPGTKEGVTKKDNLTASDQCRRLILEWTADL